MNSPRDTPPHALRVKVLPHQRLQVHFSDGIERVLCLAPLVERRACYWRLRQSRYFNQASVDPLGGICWPEGEDLAPDGLLRYVTQ